MTRGCVSSVQVALLAAAFVYMVPVSARRQQQATLGRLRGVSPLLTTPPPPALYPNFVAAVDGSAVTAKGRTVALPDGSGLAFDFQNAGAGFTVTGATAVLAAVNQTNPAGTALPVSNRLAVTVVWNGQVDRSSVLETAPGMAYYSLVAGLQPSQTYTVWVTKISEPSWNEGTVNAPEWLVLAGFATDGSAVHTPPSLPSRRLEFVGDSLTAGYGSESFGPCAATRYNSGWDVSWASLVCANFTADCNTAAWSGKGLYVNNGNGYWAPRMPEIFTWNLGSDAGGGLWNFSRYVPDAVLINLGTNDYSTPYAQQPGFGANYTAAYVQFLTNLTAAWYPPTTPIFVVVGPMTTDYLAAAQAAVTTARGAGINATLINVYGAMACPTCTGCAGHPSATGYTAVFNAVQPVVASVLGW